ncbi:hypothetical protein [Nocardia sp. NPDC052316]|uniref:hypothetical protein n=1 Tax=Nocardia sp. NPDC052316 TaxID=3364329 RepID=UPI0037CC0CA4
MTAFTGRRIAAVLSGTALTAAVVAGMAGSASAQPGPPAPPPLSGPGVIQPAPGEPVLCTVIDPSEPVVITRGEGADGPWVTIERELPPGAVPAVPIEPVPAIPADAVPGTPAEVFPGAPGEPQCVVASVR